MAIKLDKESLVVLISGLYPTYDIIDDDLIQKCGYMSRPAFTYDDLRWYWNKDKLRRLSCEKLEQIFNVIKGIKPKTVNKIIANKAIRPHAYIRLNNSFMRLVSHKDYFEYYIDGGAWSIEYEVIDGKLFSIGSHINELNGIELIPVSRKEYAKNNKGYLPEYY